MQRELGQRFSQRLFDDISKAPPNGAGKEKGRDSWSLRIAWLIAGLVHLVSVMMAAFGTALLFGAWGSFLVPILGVILLLLCWVTRPRTAQPPDRLLARSEYPLLYALSDRLSTAMGAPLVDGLAVSADFNANYREATWRRRRYVELGAPLLGVLTLEERIALMAHELSHGANGDPLRGQFLFGAVGMLAGWSSALRPLTIGRAATGSLLALIASILAIPLELVMLAASELLLLVAKGVLLLVLRQSQRAEYLADRLAARAAGAGPMQGMLEKFYLHETVQAAIRCHALTRPEEPVGPVLRQLPSTCSEDELATYRAQSRSRLWQVDSTHPPTALRIEMLSTAPLCLPSSLLTPEEELLLEDEFSRMIASTQRELMNRQLAAIYG
jgi:heat shock protein HtpX